jgi:hypothetical protein
MFMKCEGDMHRLASRVVYNVHNYVDNLFIILFYPFVLTGRQAGMLPAFAK